MKPRTVGIAVLFWLGLLATPLLAPAQQVGNTRRIGLLNFTSAAEASRFSKIFREELREYGWVEGQNLTIAYRYAEGKVERLPDLATELERLQLDLIVTVTTTATRAAMNVIKTTPIVFTVVTDPVASGFVTSLARPDRNATGPSGMGPEMAGKRLEFLREVVPDLVRVAVIWEPTSPGVKLNFQRTQREAQKLGLALLPLEVHSRDDFASAFTAVERERPDALVPITAPLTVQHTALIAEFALHHRLPTIAGWRRFPQAGGLMSYGPRFTDHFRRVVPYVDKILRGAQPSDLPVEQPTTFQLVINLKTATALGLTMPSTLLLLADEVIQ